MVLLHLDFRLLFSRVLASLYVVGGLGWTFSLPLLASLPARMGCYPLNYDLARIWKRVQVLQEFLDVSISVVRAK